MWESGLLVMASGTFRGFLYRQKKSSEILKSLENERYVSALALSQQGLPSGAGGGEGEGGFDFGGRMSYDSQGLCQKVFLKL